MASTIGELVVGVDRLGAHAERTRMPQPASNGPEPESAPSARLLPGGPVAESILADVATRVAALTGRGITPSLATVLVGDDDASAGYIRIKQRQAAELGFASPHEHLPASATQADLHAVITAFNEDPAVHGLLVQHPVPRHLDYDRALQVMDPDKDVDGMHPLNIGRLALELRARCRARPPGSRRCSRTTTSRWRAGRWSSSGAGPRSAVPCRSSSRRSARRRTPPSPSCTPG